VSSVWTAGESAYNNRSRRTDAVRDLCCCANLPVCLQIFSGTTATVCCSLCTDSAAHSHTGTRPMQNVNSLCCDIEIFPYSCRYSRWGFCSLYGWASPLPRL
jgi:hypothetical protein